MTYLSSSCVRCLYSALFLLVLANRGHGKVNEGGAIRSNIQVPGFIDKTTTVGRGRRECQKIDDWHCDFYPDNAWYCRQQWMKNNCAHRCRLCEYKVVTTPKPAPTPTPTPVKKLIVLAGGKRPACRKHDNSRCFVYPDKGWYCQQRWMKKNCAHHCGLCKFRVTGKFLPPPPAPKVDPKPVCYGDEHTRCHYYGRGKAYYCKHKWVRENCKYTCGVCKYNA